MLINKIHIASFGGLKNCELMLDDNFNIIQGPNEFGKTTLFAFIRAMLFGLKGKKGSVTKDYDRYLPLTNPTNFRGTLYLELFGEEFSIERCFYRKSRSTKITNLTLGKDISEDEWNSLLAPVDYDTFTNTCYISSETTRPGETFMDILQERIIGLAQSNSGDIFVHSSIDKLNIKEKKLKEKIKKLPKIKKSKLYDNKTDIEEKILTLENNIEHGASLSPNKNSSLIISIIAILAICAALFTTAFLPDDIKLFVSASFYIVAVILLIYLIMLTHRIKLYNSNKESLDILYGRLEELYRLLSENAEAFTACEEIEKKAATINSELEALQLAKASIQDIARTIYSANTNELNTRLSSLFTKITDDAFNGVFINEDMQIYALKDKTLYNFYHLSKGTLEQLYLCLRIVALDLLYDDLKLPIIIDDGFVHYDYKRYKNTLNILEKLNRQVIIFNLSKNVF